MLLLAQIVRVVTAVVVGCIVVGIALHLLGADAGNALVGFVYDAAGRLVSPFHGVFSPGGAKLRIALNWGLAAVVYGIAGGLLTRLLAGAAIAAEGRSAARGPAARD
jgi:hypothetical protein